MLIFIQSMMFHHHLDIQAICAVHSSIPDNDLFS